MPRLYKILTAILALTGCASLVISGEINPLMSLSGLAMFTGYYRLLKGQPAAVKGVIGALSVLTLGVFFFDTAVVSGDVFLAVAHLTIAFQAIKSFDLKEPWDHLQVYFMSLLQLIIASELTSSVAFGIVFMLFMVMLVTAMILSHFLKEGYGEAGGLKKPVVVISLLALASTFVFFAALPRTSYKFVGKSHVRAIRTSGFSTRMDFGSFENVKLDRTVVMRIEMDKDVRLPYYWRGIAFDYFDGLAWRNSQGDSFGSRYRLAPGADEYVLSPYDRRAAVEQRIYLEPMDTDVIFGLAEVRGIKTDAPSLRTDSASGIHIPWKTSRRLKYTVYSIPADSFPGLPDTRYLQLPSGMQRIAELARRATRGAATAGEKARALERYLRENYSYSLSPPVPAKGVTPIEDFLFNSKKGYCEHYATSMVLMLRSLGIPARVVTGFYGGEKNEYGGYIIVRESNAHSWVEALIDGRWKRFDPTPAVSTARPASFELFLDSLKMTWSRYVVGFSSADQERILRTVTLPFTLPCLYAPKLKHVSLKTAAYGISVLFVLCFAAYAVSRFVRRRRYGLVTAKYMELRTFLKRKGVRVSSVTTAGDLRNAVRQRGWKDAEEFLSLYEGCRFGGKEMSGEEKRRYERLLRASRKTEQ